MIRTTYRMISIGEKERLLIDFYDEKYELLSTFLETEVASFEDWIKADFDAVLSGEYVQRIINGNICHVEIGPETTKVYNELIEDDEEYYRTCCEVNTKELRQLIDEWCEKYHEFKRKQSK